MRLQTTDGQSLDLTVLGYQFPKGGDNWHDRNWLNIRIEVTHSRGRWRSTDPSLLTSEVADLATWFEDVAAGRMLDDERPFIEPNLHFDFSSGVLRVFFELESRPAWARADGAGMKDLWIDFPAADLDLQSAAADLRQQLALFPERGSD